MTYEVNGGKYESINGCRDNESEQIVVLVQELMALFVKKILSIWAHNTRLRLSGGKFLLWN